MQIHDLDTPTVVCDLDKLERNINTYADNAKSVGIPLWSHTKSHKIPEIAHMQMRSGVVGICCQKVGEAEVMAAAGITNIIIPYNVVGAPKVDRLLRLARRIQVTVAVDSETTARGIADGALRYGGEVHTLIELDTGSKRCGVQSPAEAQELARKIADLPGIDFQGVMTYPSRTTIKDYLTETVERITSDGIPVNVVSGGGTGAEQISKEIGCTDTRAGSYVWEGLTRVHSRADLNGERCPLRILTTVVSRPTSSRLIIDGGMKTFCSYPPVPYGYCVEHPELTITGMSIEHGHVDTSESSHNFQVGERLTWIPLHQEMALNLHDELVGYRGEQVEVVWPVWGARQGEVKLVVDEWMSHAAGTRCDLDAIARLMADFSQPWFFCGGWAIDLFLGRPMREHKDVDIGIFRVDQLEAQAYLLARGWTLAVAHDGVLTTWSQGICLELPIHTIWCRNLDHVPLFFDVLFNEGDLTQFRFRPKPALTHAGTEAIQYAVEGLPYLAPEIALLYKSAHVELVVNQSDFDHALLQLTTEQRRWLRHGLSTLYERHPWLDRLSF